jgi:aminoglycoside phosphotransferase
LIVTERSRHRFADNRRVQPESARSPLLIGKSGARVFRVRREDGAEWIEKSGSPDEISLEVAVLDWCGPWLPVPRVMTAELGFLAMSALPGVNLTEVPMDCAVAMIAEALPLIHAVPVVACAFQASWAVRLEQAERRVLAGLVDEADFDEVNRGRTAVHILTELLALPAPPDMACFTHGDACLPNFLTDGERLTGIVDVGRAGVAHPAQDWALALRSMRDNFGADGERLLREHLPQHCADERLLRQFRLLDELF